MFFAATALIPGKHYIDATGEECIAVRHREYSTLSDVECEVLVVFPKSGNAIPPHLLGSLTFMEKPDASQQKRRDEEGGAHVCKTAKRSSVR